VLNPCRSEPRAPCLQVEDPGWRSERAFHDVHTNGPGCTTRHNPPVEIGDFCGKMSLPKGIDLCFKRGVDLRSIHWPLTRSYMLCCPLCGGRQVICCRHCTLYSDVCYGLSCKRDYPHQGEPLQSHGGPIEAFPTPHCPHDFFQPVARRAANAASWTSVYDRPRTRCLTWCSVVVNKPPSVDSSVGSTPFSGSFPITASAWTNPSSGCGVTQYIVFQPCMINGTLA